MLGSLHYLSLAQLLYSKAYYRKLFKSLRDSPEGQRF